MAKMFRAEKVLTPIAYFNLNNPDYFKTDYWRKEFDWHVTSIQAIQDNEVYLGQLVYGKRRNKSIKSKENFSVWTCCWSLFVDGFGGLLLLNNQAY